MPRTCTVCGHPDRAEVDEALVASAPYRHIASQYSVSTASLQRHKADHLPASLTKAQDANEVANADDLLTQLRDLQTKTLGILETAEGTGKLGIALMAIGQARANIELLAKLTKQLSDSPNINVLINPSWMSLRVLLMDVLQDYPEARLAVAGSLARLEGGSAL